MRAQVTGPLLEVIVAAFVIISVLWIAVSYQGSIQADSARATCKLTIQTKNMYLEQTQGVKEKAEAALLAIKDTQLKCPMAVENIETENVREADARIAEHLYQCWDKTLGNSNKMSYQTEGLIPPTFCIVCSRITPIIDVPTDTIRNYITGAYLPGQSEKKYRDVLVTAWGAQSPIRYFITAEKPDTIPLPFQPELGGTLPRLSKEISYDVISMNLKNKEEFQSHVFIIPTSHVQNLACAELHQEKAGFTPV
ncbi:hypothetical protein HY641_04040 [Candidatus Woesearchaeota archaeon]|nr:hypothetical protein [Candidatus Woesearchaeota archaeon]